MFELLESYRILTALWDAMAIVQKYRMRLNSIIYAWASFPIYIFLKF